MLLYVCSSEELELGGGGLLTSLWGGGGGGVGVVGGDGVLG